MPKKDPDQPPADALPLQEAFWRFTDPQLLETIRQLEAAGANVPSREIYGSAWMSDNGAPFRSTTNPRWNEYRRALHAANADFRAQAVSNELLFWGRRGSAAEPLCRVQADMRYVRFCAGNVLWAPGKPPVWFYGVVVAKRPEPSKRGRRSFEPRERPLFAEMDKMIEADPTLSPERALKQLADEGWSIPGDGTLENNMDRTARHWRDQKREKSSG